MLREKHFDLLGVYSLKNFQVRLWLSRCLIYKVHPLSSLEAAYLYYHIQTSVSSSFLTFFKVFRSFSGFLCAARKRLDYNITPPRDCQQVFSKNLKKLYFHRLYTFPQRKRTLRCAFPQQSIICPVSKKKSFLATTGLAKICSTATAYAASWGA